ncbi:MAG: DUF1905 domain-containing protein [Acidimicrobiales bacterium]|jgi:uncharacterized protein DUF1905
MRLDFDGELWFWRGPSPFHFVTVPENESAEIHAVAALVTYGWGVIPVLAEIGETSWTTSLFPKDGGYVVPIKAAVRKRERLELGDAVHVALSIEVKY